MGDDADSQVLASGQCELDYMDWSEPAVIGMFVIFIIFLHRYILQQKVEKIIKIGYPQ